MIYWSLRKYRQLSSSTPYKYSLFRKQLYQLWQNCWTCRNNVHIIKKSFFGTFCCCQHPEYVRGLSSLKGRLKLEIFRFSEKHGFQTLKGFLINFRFQKVVIGEIIEQSLFCFCFVWNFYCGWSLSRRRSTFLSPLASRQIIGWILDLRLGIGSDFSRSPSVSLFVPQSQHKHLSSLIFRGTGVLQSKYIQ